MFRFFVISFEILALVVIVRTPFVQFWVSDLQSTLAEFMYEVSQMADQQQLQQFRNEIAPHTRNLNDYQKDYLLSVTDNKIALNSFHSHYCVAGDKNPFIYGASLRYVCSEISRKGILNNIYS